MAKTDFAVDEKLTADYMNSLGGEVNGKADTADIPSTSGLATTAALNSGLAGKADKSEVPDISGKADKSEIPDVSGLATQADLNAAIGRIEALEAAAEPDEG